jgi:hypothetical protein
MYERRATSGESLKEIDRPSEIVSTPPTGPVEEATRILDHAARNGVVLRLLGGVAFYLRCPSARSGELARSYGDADFVGHARQSPEIKRLFGELGYLPRERFNALHGGRRLGFTSSGQRTRVDVFLDVFEMCHKLDLRERMEIDRQTIPLADLLATKLQIIQTNEKDFGDMICLLADHEIGGTDFGDTINGEYLARLCSEDWGIYKTFTMKLAMLGVVVETWDLKQFERESVSKKIEQLRAAIERVPKSIAWRMRATIGERVRWYELPEEDVGLVEQVQAKES